MKKIKYHATFYVIGGMLVIVSGAFALTGQFYLALGPLALGCFCSGIGAAVKIGEKKAENRIKRNMIHAEEIKPEYKENKKVYVKDFSNIRKITIHGTTVHQIKKTVKEYEARKKRIKNMESKVIPMKKEPKTFVYEKDAA